MASILRSFIAQETATARTSFSQPLRRPRFDDSLWAEEDPGTFALIKRARAVLERIGR